MSSDISRQRFNPANNFNSVLMQQGRVQLDADWNEWNEILDRHWRSETIDIIGRCVVPRPPPDDGFAIAVSGGSLTIGRGRIYVDGLQAENHGTGDLEFDPILAESRGVDPVPYEKQPYLPNPPALPNEAGPHLVYVDVWEREVTSVENPDLVENAVGVDTTSRLQTVWQVRVLPNVDPAVTCATPDNQLAGWQHIIAPSAGRLTTKAVGVATPDDPCQIPPSGGYRGLENRTYRVEIQDAGPVGTATFKWSCDNASVATGISAIEGDTVLTVDRIAWDSQRRFSTGDWVEITDDYREFSLAPGEIRRIASVVDPSRTVTLDTPLTAGLFPVDGSNRTFPERHTRIKRWDQSGLVKESDGSTYADLDEAGSTGLIKVPPVGTSLILEDGVEVTFTTVPDGDAFHSGDYWIFVARTADASVEELAAAPPRGVHHHYCRLALVLFPNTLQEDCRIFWPPDFGEACCDCSVCVTAESHNAGGVGTLQSAVNQIATTGGKICLGPGTYLIKETVKVSGANNIEISGHGLSNLVASGLTSQQPIFQIDGCVDINIEDIAFTGPVVGVAISNSSFTRIKRCLFTGDAQSSPLSLGVGFSGFVWDAQVQDCFFNNVQIGIGPPTAEAAREAFIGRLSIQNNEMICTTAGFRFARQAADDPVLLFLELLFADNSVIAPIGFQFGEEGLDIAIERNSFALTSPTAGTTVNAAIVCAGSHVRISKNQILSADSGNQGTDGIMLNGSLTSLMYGTQVTDNRIGGLAGHGILIKEGTHFHTYLQETVISQNQLLGLGAAGIIMEPGGYSFDLNITNNAMTLVGMKSGDDAEIFGNTMAGILLLTPMINVNVNENTIEAVGTDPKADPKGTASRVGIELFMVIDFRAAGNRIVDVGPPSKVGPSMGIGVFEAIGRVDIADNEVRRAGVPPSNGEPSPWSAVWIFVAIGNVAIRGNILESFGAVPTAFLVFPFSCLFIDNQCFLDNPPAAAIGPPVVSLGNEHLPTGAIMASNNFVRGPTSSPAMALNPKDKDKALTVLGNITMQKGDIFVGGTPLDAPWKLLNVPNV
jgi:hypothetical protein